MGKTKKAMGCMRLRDRLTQQSIPKALGTDYRVTKAFRSTRLFAVAGLQAVQSEDMFCYSRGNTYRRDRMAYLMLYLAMFYQANGLHKRLRMFSMR